MERQWFSKITAISQDLLSADGNLLFIKNYNDDGEFDDYFI